MTLDMKILKISACGLPMFNGKCEINFLAQQRTTAEKAEKMGLVFSKGKQPFYQNNVMSFIGINASGKTTVLKLIVFVMRMLDNEPLNVTGCSDFLDDLERGHEAVFEVWFYTDNDTVNQLRTVIVKENGKLAIKEEILKSKTLTEITGKRKLFEFDDCEVSLSRDNNAEFLLEDVSVMVAFNKRVGKSIAFRDMLKYTNENQLSISEDCPPELIAFFDPSVEYLKIKRVGKDTGICLKFKEKEEVVLRQLSELNRYLSSGTIKGINTFLNAVKTFENGGYLVIDELENHFNREIVSTLIRFYTDKRVNPKGAMLIFSTHYAELLDEFERNDCVNIVRNCSGITVENLASVLKRGDIKKSEAYQSGFIGGTVPRYDSYIALKNSLIHPCEEC